MMNDPERNLALAHDDEIGAHGLQMIDLGVGMSPRDNLDTRVGGTRLLHDLSRFEGFRYRNQQISSAGEIGGFEGIGTRGISDDGLEMALAKPGDDIVGVLDDEKRLIALLHGLGNNAADATIADEDGMARQLRGDRRCG